MYGLGDSSDDQDQQDMVLPDLAITASVPTPAVSPPAVPTWLIILLAGMVYYIIGNEKNS